ncbi:pumilio homolog 1-like [Impatiens glandulifera]|uniref:pumilio homolog 1-like n=1 Tax=Impatiens glandulifera TaxID=253017 RepID=UPI001FB18231|nr:pumilio homolog 1-like [Impatiens glandulifera]
MITESYSKMRSDSGVRSPFQTDYGYGDELGLLLQGRQGEISDRERDMNLYRSGSAPPTVEGSLTAVGGLFGHGGAVDFGGLSEEEMRSDPSYIAYYYSNVNLNPRLPPPLLSKEDWRFAQRLQGSNGGSSGLGGIGDRRKVNREGEDVGNDRSLFSLQPEFNGSKEESAAEWGGNGLIGLPSLGLGSRQKSIAEIFQDDLIHSSSVSRNPSRSASRNALNDIAESSESHFAKLHHELASIEASGSSGRPMVQNTVGGSVAHTYASALSNSLSRSASPDPHFVARASSQHITPVGRISSTDKRNLHSPNSFKGMTHSMEESAHLVTAMSGLTVTGNGVPDKANHIQSLIREETNDHQNLHYMKVDQNHAKQYLHSETLESPQFHPNASLQSTKSLYSNSGKIDSTRMDMHGQFELHSPSVSSGNTYLQGSSNWAHNNAVNSPNAHQNKDGLNPSLSNYSLNGYILNPASPSLIGNQGSSLPPLFESAAVASAMGLSGMGSRSFGSNLALDPNFLSAASEVQNRSRVGSQNATYPMPHVDPMYLQYMMNDPTMDTNAYNTDLMGIQRAYYNSLLSPPKSQYNPTYINSGNHNYYGSPTFSLGMPNLGSPLAGPLLPNSSIGSGNAVKYGERSLRFPSGARNLAGGALGTWRSDGCGNLDELYASSLLDDFKSNKTKCFELSEIAGHVVEFSVDQYGSRFIQQKLETATLDEKNMVFHEIMPQSLSLMTDVFGNYVIQKFFEHGTPSQIRELADELTGHVLTLSLQMYGCRVIQKAIEVVDLDQQTKLVNELDGHVMRCVRDQNGNHVVQKCIECIPQEAIHFIISVFYDQVVTLSMHPYGCRVIQRVLEHCTDFKTQRIMMEEVLKSVCMLAQDQYGNYVVQHVMEHGKPEERTAIINKLTGQIVQMSQQKFASNVVEKCLTFGTPEERQLLVDEMLGSTDESEPLQVMMKDQFANYVVQKVLETCDDEQLGLILNKIKMHLTALKKYTYGKHIVARVEKLVAAGEKRISVLSSSSSSYPG